MARRIRGILALLVVVSILALSACGGSTTVHKAKATPTPQPGQLKFIIVADGQLTDPFWAAVERGARRAAANAGVAVSFQAGQTAGATDMSAALDAAVANQPSGLAVAIPNCAGMTTSLQRAQLVNMPIIAIATGSDCAAKLGLLSFIGQIDYQAGLAAGQKLAAEGSRHTLCVTSDPNNSAFADRCRGVNDALQKAGGQSNLFAINVSNPSAAQQKIQSQVSQDPTIDSILTVDAATAAIAVAAAAHIIRTSPFYVGTFDLSSPVLTAIQNSGLQFAIDSQPYLQGYLAVVWLTLAAQNHETAISPQILTGPSFVTGANVSQIAQAVAAGLH